jgi:hypothetical protein
LMYLHFGRQKITDNLLSWNYGLNLIQKLDINVCLHTYLQLPM